MTTQQEIRRANSLNVCSALAQSRLAYAGYVHDTIEVVAGPLVEPEPGSSATVVARFEIIHNDPLCRMPLADACVLVVAKDADVRFVAPDAGTTSNYVSYWHREKAATPGNPGWARLSEGQRSATDEVRILGQTLPAEIAPEAGAGYLHYVGDTRPGDGWTVRVGVHHPAGAEALVDLSFDVTVSARPDWTPATAPQPVLVF